MSGRTHVRAVVAMSLGGLLFGFDTAVISGVTDALRAHFDLSSAGLGAAVAAALWGTLVGAMLGGIPGDRWGAVAVLRVVGLLYIVSAIGCAVAQGLAAFIAFRVLGGLAIGASSVLVPVYIAEISPKERRGMLVGLFQFNIVFGILLAYLSNYLLAQALAGDPWRWKLAVAGVPALVFFALLTGLPQSPRWLTVRGRHGEAKAAALRLGLNPVVATQDDTEATGRISLARHGRPICLAVAMGLLNQLSGINAILYYLNDIFTAAGFGRVSADVQAVVIGLANLVATSVAMLVIDRLGRRPLLIGGGVVTAAALAGVALIFTGALPAGWLLAMLLVFIVAFAMSQGAVIWVYLSEIFPADVRARGQSIGSATHWFANAALSFGFPLIAAIDRAAPFWLFAAAMLAQALAVFLVFPETRGRSLEAISAELVR